MSGHDGIVDITTDKKAIRLRALKLDLTPLGCRRLGFGMAHQCSATHPTSIITQHAHLTGRLHASTAARALNVAVALPYLPSEF